MLSFNVYAELPLFYVQASLMHDLFSQETFHTNKRNPQIVMRNQETLVHVFFIRNCLQETLLSRSPKTSRAHHISAPLRDQIFTGVLVTEKYGNIFTGELELRDEDIMSKGKLSLC